MEEFCFLKRFPKDKDRNYKVLECDKNIGTVILDKNLYQKIAFDYLNKSNFIKLNTDPLLKSILFINNTLLSLKSKSHISQKIYNSLIVKDCKLGRFRLLVKLHKSKLGFRPIINGNNSLTHFCNIFLDMLLKPIVKNSKSYIQDSQNLLQKPLIVITL